MKRICLHVEACEEMNSTRYSPLTALLLNQEFLEGKVKKIVDFRGGSFMRYPIFQKFQSRDFHNSWFFISRDENILKNLIFQKKITK